jgi:uncharacterized protein
MDLSQLVVTVLQSYTLPWNGIHGIAHWARVLENGLRLASETGAHREVVSLFAVLHDSRRFNEDVDADHGRRAVEFAAELCGRVFQLDDARLELLYRACAGHTCELTHPDVTIQTCWDADRLDLGRVGICVDASRLCTDAARRPAMMRWADRRASQGVVPRLVLDQWGIRQATTQRRV